MPVAPQPEVGQVVEQLTGAEGEQQAVVFDEILEAAEPGTIALLLEALPLDERHERWLQVSEDEQLAVLDDMRAEPRIDMLKHMSDVQVDSILSQLTAEQLIDWSDSLPDELTDRALALMHERQRQQYARFDLYSENEIGRYVDHQVLVLSPHASVSQAQKFIRRIELDCNDTLFLTDDDDVLVGCVSHQDIRRADPSLQLKELMADDARSIRADTSLFDASEAMEHSEQLELAVIDADDRLLGRITLRSATWLMREHYEAQLMATAGLDETHDLFAPIIKGASQRAVWLGINLLTAFLASATIGLFEDVLTQVVALAVLMPIVASMGGIAGSQSLTLMIRAMATGQISSGNMWALLKNELGIGSLNGVLWAGVIGLVAGWWFTSPEIGVVIACAILINMLVAAASGVLIPVILQKLDQDAALSGSVILTTVTDVVGFLTFLGLATLLFL
ncbi:magnesium transporter [Shewanella corallii]|uniref:Magnesium transporter n=1 Tax=Shewanella corallii TaxID=560080 RepID=A0ABT0NCQ7_9GAMM|nr:magnesium transporter [Shewanella corallii]MCL2915895.1 magnesium transporter [Shewanella corallii]